MNWAILIIAGFFETGFALCLGKAKDATGNSFWYWITGFLICLIISMSMLFYASRSLPIGTAYAVWTGIGAAGTVIAGAILFNEPATFWRIFFLSTLIISIVGLKFFGNP